MLEPARLGHDRQVPAQLAGHAARTARAARPSARAAQVAVELGVDDLAAARLPVGDRRARSSALVSSTASSRAAAQGDRPARRADGPSGRGRTSRGPPSTGVVELLVGQAGERLERRPGVAFLFEEFERIEVHAGNGIESRPPGGRPALDGDRLAVLPEDAAQDRALLAERGVGRGAADEVRHQVRLARARPGGRLAQAAQRRLDLARVALAAGPLEPRQVALQRARRHGQDGHARRPRPRRRRR